MPEQPDRETDWWRTAVVYQIYPRSFADTDGDGIGDLAGVTSRLPYLAALGIDAIWLTPFYPSPLADGGYDITDHRDVDPALGTLADFDALVATAHGLGIRVLVDLVPNHTSSAHPWFRRALAAPPGDPARELYIFRDGRGAAGELPPSDWVSHFGGPAWEQVPDGQWYCHLFAPEQPDLNWAHPQVREYFLGTLRFWAERGVDGFRVDVAHALVKDLSEPLRSQPHLDSRLPLDGSDPLYDRDEVHAIYRTWRAELNRYTPRPAAVAETWSPANARTYLYARPDELGQVFDFSLLKAGWDAAAYRNVISTALRDHREHAAEGGLTWVLSSHDVPRHASRLGLAPTDDPDAWLRSDGRQPVVDPAVGLRRARAATLLMLALPGSAYLYQGEELGLPEVADLPDAALRDPVFARSGGRLKGRDGCRVPLPWTRSGASFGFGPGGSWLPQPPEWGELSVEAQDGVAGSTLQLYRAALALRRRLPTAEALTWLDPADPDVLHYRRPGGWRCAANLAPGPRPRPPGTVLLSSGTPPELIGDELPGETTVWLQD